MLTVVVLTAIALVTAALLIARLAAPRTFNPQKGEPYECGVPTRGEAWFQFHAGYYLYAILFLIFDMQGLLSIVFFIVVLILGLAYAWRKGALEWK